MKCNKCDKEFENKSQLANHIRWHHKAVEIIFTCSCGKTFKDNSGFITHQKCCDGTGTKSDKKKALTNPNWICSKCGCIIKNQRKKHEDSCDGSGPRRLSQRKNPSKRGSEEFCRRVSEGVRRAYKETNLAEKISISLKNAYLQGKRTGLASTQEKELERRRKIRIKINERYAHGWEVKCGRAKKYSYSSPIAGDIKVDGTWELKVASYFDTIGVKWYRNKKRFSYINFKNKESTYCPDFFVEDWNTYVEVKGYTTDLDYCKWKQFTENLVIWDKNKLRELKILE